MLKTVDFTTKRNQSENTVMLLGGFDGLHVGHRQLLQKAKQTGLPVGIMCIVGGKENQSLFTLSEREDVFARAGIDFVFELPFTEIKTLSQTEFLGLLTDNFQPSVFVCGEDFRFGYGAKGTPESIKKETGVRVEICPKLCVDGETVSTTMVKKLLTQGNVEKAGEILGERFFLLGEVFEDRGVGRTLGFPTANIRYPHDKYSLKQGVYHTTVEIDGKRYQGITNYGNRPTFDSEDVLTETYLDGFVGTLYGKTLKIEFVRYLREIRKFDNANALQRQLQTDIRTVRNDY